MTRCGSAQGPSEARHPAMTGLTVYAHAATHAARPLDVGKKYEKQRAFLLVMPLHAMPLQIVQLE